MPYDPIYADSSGTTLLRAAYGLTGRPWRPDYVTKVKARCGSGFQSNWISVGKSVGMARSK